MCFSRLFINPQVWLHIFLSIFSVLCLAFVLHLAVASYTDHHEVYVVPDFKGLKVNALEKLRPHPGIQIIITDSVYDPKMEPGIVLRQEPFPGEKLKRNGKIYLITTTTHPPLIPMPKLTDLSERQARHVLRSYGLKCGEVIEKAAECNGCIIDQVYKGKTIRPGEPIEKGSIVHLVVGSKKLLRNSSDTLPINYSDSL